MTSSDGIRDCHVIKRQEEEFEFFLKVDDSRGGQIISSLTAGGPAERCGLKDGDRVVEVNGVNVENKEHGDVVELIRESIPKNEIKFKVVDAENDPNSKKEKVISNASSESIELRPRICKITKKRNTFGFSLEAQGITSPGHFIKEVTDGGPAVESGLRVGDRIIEVGGTNVEKMKHEKVVAQIKKGGNKVILLVVDEATYKHYTTRKMRIKAKRAYSSSDVISDNRSTSTSSQSSIKSPSAASVAASSEDENARLVHVVKVKERGYGFYLRVKENEKGEYIGDLEKGKPGEKCGIMQSDRLIAVNGKVVIEKEHEDVVALIKSNPNHVVMLVLGPKALQNAENNGVLSTLRNAKQFLLDKPRVVKLTKGEDGYGFFLKMDKGSPLHIISDVEDGSPAHEAGLKNDEILACVGKTDIMHLAHSQCVKAIKDAGDNVELTVANSKVMQILYDLEIAITSDILDNWPNESDLKLPQLDDHDRAFMNEATAVVAHEAVPKPKESRELRICKLTKIDGGFGFFLRDEDGHFLGNIEKGGAADKAGVKENDQIIEINGVNIEKENHDQAVDRIRNSGNEVSFLVTSAEEKSYFKSSVVAAAAVARKDSVETNAPLPRLCKLTKDEAGFGFHLNGESGGQYIRRVMDGGAADKAGLKNGDRVIEVNDENISEKSHDEVVNSIKTSGTQVAFLVVDKEADDYYKKKEIQITVALIAAKMVVESKEIDANVETHSTSSSVIEAEATVHVEPDQEPDKSLPPMVVFPPPPQEDNEIDVTEMIDNAIEEIREQEQEEAREEIVEEIQEEVKEAVREEAVEEIKEAVLDEIKEEVKEAIHEEAVEEIKEAVLDEIKEEVKEAVREEEAKELREAVLEEIKEEVKDAIIEEAKDERREEIIQELRKDVVTAAIAEEIQNAKKEKAEEEFREAEKQRIKEELRRELEQRQEQEEKQRMKEELRKEVERELEREKQHAAIKAAEENSPKKVTPKYSISNSNQEEKKPFRPVVKSSLRDRMAMFQQSESEPVAKPSWRRSTSSDKPGAPKENGVKSPTTKPPMVNGGAETPGRQTSWSGNGMSLNIVETSAVFN